MDLVALPPRPARRDGPLLLSDLPIDVLRLVMAKQLGTDGDDDAGGRPGSASPATELRRAAPSNGGPATPAADISWNEKRARLANVLRQGGTCRAFAAAVQPPSALWAVLRVSAAELLPDHVHGPGLRAAIAAAAPSVKSCRVHFPARSREHCPPHRLPEVADAIMPAAPHLADLRVTSVDGLRHAAPSMDWAAPLLAAATRLSKLTLDKIVVAGPPPMLADGVGAILALAHETWEVRREWEDWPDHTPLHESTRMANAYGHVLAATAALTSAADSGAAGSVGLTTLDDLVLPWDRAGSLVAAELGGALTRLRVRVVRDEEGVAPGARPEVPGIEPAAARLAALVSSLPALEDLHVLSDPWGAVALDLRSVAAPPRGLTRLAVGPRREAGDGDVLLPPLISGRVAVLELEHTSREHPPRCLHNAGAAFTSLTKLVYGTNGPFAKRGVHYARDEPSVNIAAWGHANFSVPSLQQLDISARTFRLENYVGEGLDWATAVATVTLPGLTRLRLRSDWGCDEFPGGPDVEDAVVRALPAAAVGRRLVVAVDDSLEDQARTEEKVRQAYEDRPAKFEGLRLEFETVAG